MNHEIRRAKIIATIGPAVAGREKLFQLAKAGMDLARLNFSYGDHESFSRIIADLREVESELGRPIGIMGDIRGPKLRVGKLESGRVILRHGTEVCVATEKSGGKKEGTIVIPVDYPPFFHDVAVGNVILFDDGLISIKVTKKGKGELWCQVIDGGVLNENKGVNVPEAKLSGPSVTDKDRVDASFCVDMGIDFIAMSFVREASDIESLRSFLSSRSSRMPILAKIEKREALNRLDEIIDASDGVLVARGDLAVEVGNERVPILQKKLIRKSNLRAKPVIVATQMLMSMVENPRPTRAEASDVANAILDGADALLLSNETTIGKYPEDAVKIMSRIMEQAERETDYRQPILFDEWELPEEGDPKAMALLQGAVRLASIVKAKLIVVLTQSGNSALLVSACRPVSRVVAVTGSRETFRKLALPWGIEPLLMEDMAGLMPQTTVFEAIGQRLRALNLCRSGDTIVITAGLPRLAHGSTNTIKVQQVE